MKAGLVPPDVGQTTIDRLKNKIVDLKSETKNLRTETEEYHTTTEKIGHAIKHLFDPVVLIKASGAFVGIHAAIHAIKDELEEIQQRVERRVALLLKPNEKQKLLDEDITNRQKDVMGARSQAAGAQDQINAAQDQANKQYEDLDRQEAEDKKAIDLRKEDYRLQMRTAEEEERHRQELQKRQADSDAEHVRRAKNQFFKHPSIERKEAVADAERDAAQHHADAERENRLSLDQKKQRIEQERRARDEDQSRAEERQAHRQNIQDQVNAAVEGAAAAQGELFHSQDELKKSIEVAERNRKQPGTAYAAQREKGGKGLEDVEQRAEGLHPDEPRLNDKEYESLEHAMRASGEGWLERQFRHLVAGHNARSEGEYIMETRLRDYDRDGHRKDGQEMSESEKQQVELLEQIARHLFEISQRNTGMTAGPE
jgi:hypothetical protein